MRFSRFPHFQGLFGLCILRLACDLALSPYYRYPLDLDGVQRSARQPWSFGWIRSTKRRKTP